MNTGSLVSPTENLYPLALQYTVTNDRTHGGQLGYTTIVILDALVSLGAQITNGITLATSKIESCEITPISTIFKQTIEIVTAY